MTYGWQESSLGSSDVESPPHPPVGVGDAGAVVLVRAVVVRGVVVRAVVVVELVVGCRFAGVVLAGTVVCAGTGAPAAKTARCFVAAAAIAVS